VTLPLPTDQPLGGRFVVEREVGRGAVGVVYRAYDVMSGQAVALKIVASEAGVAPDDEERLKREGEVLKGLNHPGIVRIVDSGLIEETGSPFVAMEWLEGEDLGSRQRRSPLSLPEVVSLGALVAQALRAAHDAGVIHRDIKPGNILLRNERPADEAFVELGVQPVLVDFGVAARKDLRSTRAGDIVGTPAYMAPEQARGGTRIDGRADLYSLGATLFELVAGRPPHQGPNVIAMLARLVTTEPPRLSELRRETPPALDDLVRQLLATDPDQRPSTAQEVEALLREALDDCHRTTWNPAEPPPRLGSSASRLVTTLVALHFGTASSRERALEQLAARSAEAVPLGTDALVAHLGARRAVGNEAATALDLGRRLARAGAQVGVASGRARVESGRESGRALPLGEVVDRASALARDAGRGTVLVDATTSELGRGRYEFRVRDDGSAIVGEQVRGGGGADRVGGAPFFGREPEMAQVLRAYERALDDRTPIFLSVTGPPGIGKSRLRREMLARVSTRAEAPHVILQRSDPYGRAHALGAAADVLRAIVELPKGSSISEALRAIENRLGPETRNELSGENRLLLARLLVNEPIEEGLGQRGARDALWLGMTDLVLQVVQNEPAVVVMEDLQWADPESIGWLDHMLGRAVHKPLLVMACVRPTFWAEHGQRFAGRDHLRIDLRPISRRASRGIASALLGENVPEAVLERIAEQAAGSPLFAEELSRLAATGRDPTGAPTIEAAIQVSLDALDEECRDAVGRLSVFGLTCWDSALEALGIERPESVMRALGAAEVLVQQVSSRFPGASEWTFKHALVRDVAYQALGVEQRRELHALAAGWLESMGEDATTVAGHYDLGGKNDVAAEHWERAAQRALAANALTDAMIMAERALAYASDKTTGFRRASYLDEAWSRLDPRASDRESALRLLEENVHDEASAVRALGARARYDDARGTGTDISERLAEARDKAASLGLTEEVARCSAALAARAAFAGRFERADAEARRLLEMAREHGLRTAAVDAYQTQAIIRQSRGALSLALEARRNAAGAARSAGLKEREAMLTTNLGFALTTIGARQEARGALETGLALAEAIGSMGAVRHAQMNLLGWAAAFGNDKRLETHLSEVRADADAAASGIWAAPDRSNLGTLFYRGVELLRSKDSRASLRALSLLRMAASSYRQIGHHDLLPVALGTWAEAERVCRNVQAAVRIAAEAVELLQSGAPSLLNESPVYLALHDALADQGHLDEARDAIALGVPPLMRRVHGLVGTPYARQFLTELPANTAFIAVAERFGLVPDEVHTLLARGSS
jgi:hypothetical protein